MHLGGRGEGGNGGFPIEENEWIGSLIRRKIKIKIKIK